MKKIILIKILLFCILSCENQNFDENIDIKIINNDKSNLEQNRNTEDSEILAFKLKIVAYITGRVLLNSRRARSIVLSQLQGRTSISFNELFYPNIILDGSTSYNRYFMSAFENESLFFEGRPTTHRPIPPITDDGRSSNMNQFTKKINSPFITKNYDLTLDLSYSFLFIDGVSEFVETNCFELFFVKPLSITENSHIYITNHPLLENNDIDSGFSGFNLWDNDVNEEEGEYINFNQNLLQNTTENLLVVRPYRTDQCSFEDINVNDFTDFYGN